MAHPGGVEAVGRRPGGRSAGAGVPRTPAHPATRQSSGRQGAGGASGGDARAREARPGPGWEGWGRSRNPAPHLLLPLLQLLLLGPADTAASSASCAARRSFGRPLKSWVRLAGEEPASAGWVADTFTPDARIEFVGPFGPKNPDGSNLVATPSGLIGLIKWCMAGFSDLCICPTNDAACDAARVAAGEPCCVGATGTAFRQGADGGWRTTIQWTGTHDGPFQLAENLAVVKPTGKRMTMMPEAFTAWVDDAGKIKRLTVEPLEEGLSGPPGMYIMAGGVIPVPGRA